MAAQTPVVASDIDGYRDVVTDDQDGVLVPPGDAAALAHALLTVIDDAQLGQRLVRGGDARAAQLSMHALARRYLEIYREVLIAEAEERIVVQPSTLVRYFEDRLLRRPRFAQFSQNMVDSLTDSVNDTMNTLRDKSQLWRERVTGERSDDE